MEQKYEAMPKAEIRLEGRKVIRGDVAGDWGLRLQFEVKHNGKVVATPAARAVTSYEHPTAEPGMYEIVLQSWKYVNYIKQPDGQFVNSKFVEISNKVTYTI